MAPATARSFAAYSRYHPDLPNEMSDCQKEPPRRWGRQWRGAGHPNDGQRDDRQRKNAVGTAPVPLKLGSRAFSE